MTRQAVSKHIKILNECELLEQQKAGREIFYQFKVDKMKEIDTWLEQFRTVWETRFNQLDKYLSLFNAGKPKEQHKHQNPPEADGETLKLPLLEITDMELSVLHQAHFLN